MANQLNTLAITATTDGSGDATATAEKSVFGWLIGVQWIDGDFADGVDAVLSVTNRPSPAADRTLLTLTDANDDAMYYPREDEHDNTGSAASTTTLPLIDGTPKLVVSSGGATKTGGVILYYTDR